MLTGIDISNFQHPGGAPIDFAAVKASGIDFVFILATDAYRDADGRMFVNPYFRQDWQDARDAGLIRGAYHFARPSADPVTQALFFSNTVGGLQQYDLLMCDFENGAGDLGPLAIQLLNAVAQQRGVNPFLYSGPAFLQQHGLLIPELSNYYGLHYAWWAPGPPTAPAPWDTWAIWQTGTGTCPGIQGDVDLDVFNGDLAQLQRYGYRGAEPPVPEPSDSLKLALQQIYDTAGRALQS